MGSNEQDELVRLLVDKILEGLGQQGWIVGDNLGVEVRYNEGDSALSDLFAAELLALGVDIFIAAGPPNAMAAARSSSEIPIIFFVVGDPIGEGLVESYARPGRNATGFTKEGSLGGQYLDLLSTMYPDMRSATMMFNPDALGPGEDIGATFGDGLAALGISGSVVHVRSVREIEAVVRETSAEPRSGLVFGSDQFIFSHRPEILNIVGRYSLPAIYPILEFVTEGGLMAYSVDRPPMARATGVLAGRVLNGEDPAQIPVRAPEKFVTAINLATAARLGLDVPLTLLTTADVLISNG